MAANEPYQRARAGLAEVRPGMDTERKGAFVRYSGDEWNRISPAVRLKGRSV